MSLYHEAVQVLNTASQKGGSIKSIVFGKKDWKSDVKTLFALATETAKWSAVLSEVIERSGILKNEKQLTPELALVLIHDLLLAKRGLALPSKHGLVVTIGRHKARLTAELSKVRIKQGFASLEMLRAHVNGPSGRPSNLNGTGFSSTYRHPRWVRINTIRTSLHEQLQSTFASYERVNNVATIGHASHGEKLVYLDDHVPNLVAIPDSVEITSTSAYKAGHLILQDKASCFPAFLLEPAALEGDIIDACAAPGNKTTHLASLVSSPVHGEPLSGRKRKIFACERDSHRSTTLLKMVKLAGADDLVQVKARQDFLKLDPRASDFVNVTAILLDPSCSGSGIVGRDEATLDLHLPRVDSSNGQQPSGKKRKRGGAKVEEKTVTKISSSEDAVEEEVQDVAPNEDSSKLAARLSALSNFQLRLLEHAMAFPAAQRITYSTCSLHDEENEHVATKALLSDIALKCGWRILKREEQVDGMRKWHKRGRPQGVVDCVSSPKRAKDKIDVNAVAEACIRCEKGSEDGTMGFFVVGFIRDGNDVTGGIESSKSIVSAVETVEDTQEDEWEGFSDQD